MKKSCFNYFSRSDFFNAVHLQYGINGRYPVKDCEYSKIAVTENEKLGV